MVRTSSSQRVASRRAELGHRPNSRDFSLIFWVLMIAILLLLVGLPSFWLIWRSFSLPECGGFTLSNYNEVFTNTRLLKAVLNSLILATGVGCMSVLIGVPMAWAVIRTKVEEAWQPRSFNPGWKSDGAA